MHYHQWTDEHAYQEFVRTAPPERVRFLDEAVPGIERHGTTRYEPYRSYRSGDRAREPGCVVVSIGADSAERARCWVDTVIAALGTDPESRPGLISANFHVSADGTRVLNDAERVDVQEQVRALDDGESGVGHVPAWDVVRSMRGTTQLGFKRFRPGHRVVGPTVREFAS